eukprot:3648834-Rhodomonas_salina.1
MMLEPVEEAWTLRAAFHKVVPPASLRHLRVAPLPFAPASTDTCAPRRGSHCDSHPGKRTHKQQKRIETSVSVPRFAVVSERWNTTSTLKQ